MKIDFFTPLPPLPTEIGNHSVRMLPALARRADVTVWTDQEDWTPLPGIRVQRFHAEGPPFRELNKADAAFYNIGNNQPLHGSIYGVARRFPGIVILHDTNLQNFFAHYGVSGPESAPLYLDAMRRWHGSRAEREGRMLIEGKIDIEALMRRYPLTPAAAEGAIGIVTHGQTENETISAATRLPVYFVPLSFDVSRVHSRTAPVRRDPPWRLIVFGFIGGNRRLPVILQALARSENRERFVLDIFGSLEDPAGIAALVAELGLSGQVAIHGFVAQRLLDDALAGADLAINLRNPTMGEASSSQLHLWANALPTLVSRVGWYAAIPSDTVFHVDPDQEEAGVQAYLTAFAVDRTPFVAAGKRGRQRLLAFHGVDQYADALLRIATEAPLQHARRTAVDLARSATRGLLAFSDRGQLKTLAPGIAGHIAALTAVQGIDPAG